jgi:hypothetical protein
MTRTLQTLRIELANWRQHLEAGTLDMLTEAERKLWLMDVALMQAALSGCTPIETAGRGWELVDALLKRVGRE